MTASTKSHPNPPWSDEVILDLLSYVLTGVSWQVVGQRFGVSRQNARFKGERAVRLLSRYADTCGIEVPEQSFSTVAKLHNHAVFWQHLIVLYRSQVLSNSAGK